MKVRVGYDSRLSNKELMIKGVSVQTINNLQDDEHRIKKVMKIAKENINNTHNSLENLLSQSLKRKQQILNGNDKALDVKIYKISPKLFPLANYPGVEYFRYIDKLKEELEGVGELIKRSNIRASIYTENNVVINSVSEKIYEDSIKDIRYQNSVLTYMKLDEAKVVLNVDDVFWGKMDSAERMKSALEGLDHELIKRIVFTNGGKTVNVEELLNICMEFSVPFLFNADNKVYDYEKILLKTVESWKNSKLPPIITLPDNKSEKVEKINLFTEEARKKGYDLDMVIYKQN